MLYVPIFNAHVLPCLASVRSTHSPSCSFRGFSTSVLLMFWVRYLSCTCAPQKLGQGVADLTGKTAISNF